MTVLLIVSQGRGCERQEGGLGAGSGVGGLQRRSFSSATVRRNELRAAGQLHSSGSFVRVKLFIETA